jgi:hypothetical protein
VCGRISLSGRGNHAPGCRENSGTVHTSFQRGRYRQRRGTPNEGDAGRRVRSPCHSVWCEATAYQPSVSTRPGRGQWAGDGGSDGRGPGRSEPRRTRTFNQLIESRPNGCPQASAAFYLVLRMAVSRSISSSLYRLISPPWLHLWLHSGLHAEGA